MAHDFWSVLQDQLYEDIEWVRLTIRVTSPEVDLDELLDGAMAEGLMEEAQSVAEAEKALACSLAIRVHRR